MYSAEVAVLWVLTGQVAEAGHAVQHSLDTVVWLDAAAARARYGRWIGGVLPELVPFPKTGKARGGSVASSKAAAAATQQQQGEQEEEEGGGAADDSERHWVYLRRLRCAWAGPGGLPPAFLSPPAPAACLLIGSCLQFAALFSTDMLPALP
jgi:hypothetical protein